MMVKSVSKSSPAPPQAAIWNWYRLAATTLSLLIFVIGAAACLINLFNPRALDFLSFWAAGRLALDGHAALAYDAEVHRSVERLAVQVTGLLPFPYPPAFLLVVTPFALVPYEVGFILWVVLTSLFFVWAGSRLTEWRYPLSNPLLIPNLLIGQNGLLLAGIVALGMAMLSSSPFIAGLILGMLVIKPQLALLLPVAMLAGREWRAIFGGALSSTFLTIVAAVLFGFDAYRAFFELLPTYVRFMSEAKWPWAELASVFAFARYFGLTSELALGVHFAVAAVAATLTARAWWLKSDERVPILAAGTLLVSPYILTYDALLLFIPIAWLIERQRQPAMVALIWLMSLWPVAGYFGPPGPNTVPIAALLCLWALTRPKESATTAAAAAHPPVRRSRAG
jgi:alpha-1,2-mannosyltransferase